ncbi:MAG: transposase [Candidatus Endonucleobacter sp. (ex Gigantidas childressi)]|nr:transposase [Candidatus Endonucleobacter sp. (ex Gigantidas childressi)]
MGIKRFCADYGYSFEQLGELILSWLDMDRFTLCMSRINWTHYPKNVNHLAVSIAWQGTSTLIVWECLDKKRGNSNTDERIAVMERVLNLIPIKRIDNLLADREFIGHEWLDWLRQNKLSCRILVKSNNVVAHRSKKIAVGKLCTGVSINQTVTWHSKKKVSGVPFYIAARRTLKGLLIIVATKQPGSIIDGYSKRWSIETMFGNLKVGALIWSPHI